MLTILVPILNEEKLICNAINNLNELLSELDDHDHHIKVLVSDGGSVDKTLELAGKCIKNFNFELLTNKLVKPSIGKTINQGLERIQDGTVLVLPVDCEITLDNLKFIINESQKPEFSYGGFAKRYQHSNALMRLYATSQNFIRTRLSSNFVWTNGIFFKMEVTKVVTISEEGFMEDVIFSDDLKRNFKATYGEMPIIVGSRLYDKDGQLKRILINGLIMLIYRIGFKNKNILKFIYKL